MRKLELYQLLRHEFLFPAEAATGRQMQSRLQQLVECQLEWRPTTPRTVFAGQPESRACICQLPTAGWLHYEWLYVALGTQKPIEGWSLELGAQPDLYDLFRVTILQSPQAPTTVVMWLPVEHEATVLATLDQDLATLPKDPQLALEIERSRINPELN